MYSVAIMVRRKALRLLNITDQLSNQCSVISSPSLFSLFTDDRGYVWCWVQLDLHSHGVLLSPLSDEGRVNPSPFNILSDISNPFNLSSLSHLPLSLPSLSRTPPHSLSLACYSCRGGGISLSLSPSLSLPLSLSLSLSPPLPLSLSLLYTVSVSTQSMNSRS